MSSRTLAVLAFALGLLGTAALALWPRGGEPRSAEAHDQPGRASGRLPAVAAPGALVQPAAGTALEAELARLRRAHSGEALRVALVDALAAGAETDPAAAVRLAAALGDLEGRVEALHEALPHWLAADPASARAWLLGEAGDLPPEIVSGLARDAAAFDPELGRAVAQRLLPNLRAAAIADVFGAWTARDPRAAARAAEQLVERSDREAAAGEVARLWTETGAEASFAWASGLHDGIARKAALEAGLAAWALRDPAAAARALAALGPDPLLAGLAERVAGVWAQTDAEPALAWVQALGDPRAREAAATTLLGELIATQPRRAVEWAIANPGANTEQQSALLTKVVSGWVARDARAALDWAVSRPRNALQRQALIDLALERWREQDPRAAASWLRAHGGENHEG